MNVEKLAITDRDTWLGWRRQDVTASDIGAICGLSEYKTALGVWAEKAGAIEPEENDAMRTGRYLEDAVIAYMREAHPNWQIVKPQLYYRAPEHRLGATPDAMANDEHGRRVNIQAKSVARPQFDKWEGTPPVAYQLQVAAEAMLQEADYSILAVMTKEFRPEFHEYRIDRNAKAEARVLDMVAEFWASVEAGKTPAVDFSRDLQLLVRLKPPKPELDPIDFANDNHLPEILAELERLKVDEKEVERRIAEIRAEIIDKLDGHPLGTCDGWKFRHRMQTRNMPAREAYTQTFPVLTVTREKQQQGESK